MLLAALLYLGSGIGLLGARYILGMEPRLLHTRRGYRNPILRGWPAQSLREGLRLPSSWCSALQEYTGGDGDLASELRRRRDDAAGFSSFLEKR